MINPDSLALADVTCERCGSPAVGRRIEVTSFADPEPVFLVDWSCTKAGCVDEDGYRACLPPDQPGELTREDRLWIRRHQRLAAEYGRADRLLRSADV